MARALSPAKVTSVTLEGEGDERAALVVVPDSQLSLAIGKKGQNARLAAKLTGLGIDVKSESELEDERRQREARARGIAGAPRARADDEMVHATLRARSRLAGADPASGAAAR